MKKSSKKQNRGEADDLTSVCAEPRPDDGIPPAILSKRERQNRDQRQRVGKVRSAQLCEQIRHALADALICDCDDQLLADTKVERVEAVSGSSSVMASLSFETNDAVLIDEVFTRLQAASGRLRASIAGAIHRKRVPHLRFTVIMTEPSAD